jgi:hypothetical protein
VAMAAHGGLERWLALRSVRAEMAITGAIWAAKGRPNVLGHVQVAANLHEQYLVLRPSSPASWYTNFDQGSMSLYEPGGLIERREHPGSMYAEHAASDHRNPVQHLDTRRVSARGRMGQPGRSSAFLADDGGHGGRFHLDVCGTCSGPV